MREFLHERAPLNDSLDSNATSKHAALRIGLLAWLSALLLMLRHFDFSVTPGDGGLVTHGKKKQR